MNFGKRIESIKFPFVKCSERIRSLREEKKESHATLGQAVGVSEQTLKNYEQAAIHGGQTTGQDRVTKIAGMSINTLFQLADHFDVSTDYLLGRTDIKATDTDLREVCQLTKLSETTVNALIGETQFLPDGQAPFFHAFIDEFYKIITENELYSTEIQSYLNQAAYLKIHRNNSGIIPGLQLSSDQAYKLYLMAVNEELFKVVRAATESCVQRLIQSFEQFPDNIDSDLSTWGMAITESEKERV